MNLVLKLGNRTFANPSHEKLLRSCLAFTTTAVVSIKTSRQFDQESLLLSDTQTEELLESHSSRSLDPNILISLLIRSRSLPHVKQVHAQVTVNGMLQNLFVANKLLYVYGQHKELRDSYALFCEMDDRDSYTWSVIIGGFAKAGDYSSCFGLFGDLIRCGVRPDNYTLPCLIRVCRDMMDIQNGRIIHDIVLKHGLHLDHFVCAALVGMYAKCRVIEDARQLFDNMTSRDLVSWTVMIGGYAECKNAYESLVLFDRMIEEGVVPDKVAMVTVVNACAKLGALHKAIFVHKYIFQNRFSLDVILGTAMIDMYAKSGSVDCARDIFDRMREKNVVSWSAMIAAYGYHGQGREALDIFSQMLSNRVLPNSVTFISLLYACSHAGMVEEGLRFFSMMQEEYPVRVDVKHYTCMVDLLGRAGRLDEAWKLIESMKVEKDEALWGSLLGACRTHGNIELAEVAANSLLELQPQNAGNYVVLSNIYAKANRWNDVAKIRCLMTQRRVKKVTGWSWIEVYNVIYQFSSGDRTHPQSGDIYGMLESLNEKLERAGYVPDTNLVLHDVDEEVKVGMLLTHSEKLAIVFGLISTPEGTPIRITKNLRICGDCHSFGKSVSAITQRVIIVRDASRFHHFKEGFCSCKDYW